MLIVELEDGQVHHLPRIGRPCFWDVHVWRYYLGVADCPVVCNGGSTVAELLGCMVARILTVRCTVYWRFVFAM